MSSADKFWILFNIGALIATYNWFGKWGPVLCCFGGCFGIYLSK